MEEGFWGAAAGPFLDSLFAEPDKQGQRRVLGGGTKPPGRLLWGGFVNKGIKARGFEILTFLHHPVLKCWTSPNSEKLPRNCRKWWLTGDSRRRSEERRCFTTGKDAGGDWSRGGGVSYCPVKTGSGSRGCQVAGSESWAEQRAESECEHRTEIWPLKEVRWKWFRLRWQQTVLRSLIIQWLWA